MLDQCDRKYCEFEPRYNTTPPSDEAIRILPELNYSNSEQDFEYIELLTAKIYLGDFCKQCGRFVSVNHEPTT